MTRPHQLPPMEPDHAREVVVNLIRRQTTFVCEIDPAKVKDMVCIALGAVWEKRPDYDYVDMTATALADACQFAHNCVRDEMSFGVTVHVHHREPNWQFTAERPKRRTISRGA